MNDAFSSDLRRHLVSTADERPADGQLAAITQRVAVTPQRRPLLVRLASMPDRYGPVPAQALRYALLAAALLALVAGAAILAGAMVRHPDTLFEGTWSSVDPADGSQQTLSVSGGLAPAVQFVDEYATGAACVADAVKRFTAEGDGAIDGQLLTVRWPGGGGCGSRTVDMGDGRYRYVESNDTLVDGQNLTWRRVQDASPLPTRNLAVATPGPATATPETWCAEIAAGATYTNAVDGLSLTVTIPASAQFQWQGLHDSFSVSRSCLFRGPVGIHASRVVTVAAACDASAWVDVKTPADAVAALASAQGVALSAPTAITIGGHPATRFEVAANAQLCFDEVLLWNDKTVARGTTMIIYVVDVDGRAFGITIESRGNEAPPAQLAEAEAILASLQISPATGPQPTLEPAMTPDSTCIQFDNGGTYTARIGSLSISATLPDAAGTYWRGLRGSFYLERAPCLYGGSSTLQGSLVTQIPADACHWESPGAPVANAAAAAAALTAQAASEVIGHTHVTIDGRPAERLLVTLASGFDTSVCDGGGQAGLWPLPEGETAWIQEGDTETVYLVDVDGSILAFRETHDASDDAMTPTLLAEIDAIIGSVHITP